MVLRKSFYIRWSAGRSPRVHEVNPGRDPSKSFLDVHLNDHLFLKLYVSFMGDEFSGVPPQALQTFPHFYELSPMDPYV